MQKDMMDSAVNIWFIHTGTLAQALYGVPVAQTAQHGTNNIQTTTLIK